ncbi:unnamed protein product [Mytilus edulis]|uniref:Integrase catalytic domain-containing protein n=1 Tax=Mytilus edulis TaxID=6550 RepID=A0A8S3RDA3_MYTED|nr:unnamed protein product [Mytilus edulis]
MMEQNTVPDEGYVFERKRKKGISKDPNAETFWADMPYYVEIAKAKEQNSKWGPKKIIAELKLGLSERVVKTVLSQYFYDQNTDCLFRKSIDLNVHHRRCVSKNDLVNMIKENHKKDHRKADTIYEALRTTVFPVVRETIKILFKTEVKCQQCASAIDLPKTTTTRRPIPATYPNSRWQVDLKKMPAVRGYTYACNIINCYSRFAFGGPTKTKTAKEIADLILKFLYLLGSPRILQSDNGKEFSNSNLADVIDVFKTRQIHGRPYHPQSQGRVERFNRTLKEFYYNYNNRVHKATKPATPYQLFFQRPNFAPPVDEQLQEHNVVQARKQNNLQLKEARTLGSLERYFYFWILQFDDTFPYKITLSSKIPFTVKHISDAISALVIQHPVLRKSFLNNGRTVKLVEIPNIVDYLEILSKKHFDSLFNNFSLNGKSWRLVMLEPDVESTHTITILIGVHHALSDYIYNRQIITSFVHNLDKLQHGMTPSSDIVFKHSKPIEEMTRDTPIREVESCYVGPTYQDKKVLTATELLLHAVKKFGHTKSSFSSSRTLKWKLGKETSQIFLIQDGNVKDQLLHYF